MVKWIDKAAAIRALEHDGKVDPDDLIEAAKATSHPCHDDFTWNRHAAAQERWRDQARALIRRCKFSVLVDDVTERVVQYLPSGDEESLFISVPRLRAKGQTKAAMLAELRMLLGLVARIRGIALAKQGIIGPNVAVQLGVVSGIVEALLVEMEE